ncbi:hypothetical protein FA15DRAFT_718190 [Coprinopsis marcescibilis]|uniref:Uncharacterized protein n=1 Tax=Coprinopsis marcescibilis TaxID=230819 RepID=A0A5C3KKZ6_COPMA|nr:hypothetical protein FA15DRAFT_718190 [Coprinopsis marcescibilis]
MPLSTFLELPLHLKQDCHLRCGHWSLRVKSTPLYSIPSDLMILSTYLAGPASPWTFGIVGLLATAARAQIITEYYNDNRTIAYSPSREWTWNSYYSQIGPEDPVGCLSLLMRPRHLDSLVRTACRRRIGRRVEYHAPLWTYGFTTQITLDTDTPEIVRLQLQDPDADASSDGASAMQISALRWSAEDLDTDDMHTLVIGVPAGESGIGVVDFLIVESDEPATSSIPSAFTVPPVGPTRTRPPSGVDESPQKVIGKTIGVAVAGVIIALSFAAWRFWRQRH